MHKGRPRAVPPQLRAFGLVPGSISPEHPAWLTAHDGIFLASLIRAGENLAANAAHCQTGAQAHGVAQFLNELLVSHFGLVSFLKCPTMANPSSSDFQFTTPPTAEKPSACNSHAPIMLDSILKLADIGGSQVAGYQRSPSAGVLVERQTW